MAGAQREMPKMVDTKDLFQELNYLAAFHERMMKLIRRLFVDDDAGYERMKRVLEGTHPDDTGVNVDLAEALEQCLDERDVARATAAAAGV